MTLEQSKQLKKILWLVMMKDFILNIWFYQLHIHCCIYRYQDCKVLSILDDLNLRVQDYTNYRVHKFLCSQIHQNIGRNQLYWQQSMHLWNWSNIGIIMFSIYIVLFQNFSPLYDILTHQLKLINQKLVKWIPNILLGQHYKFGYMRQYHWHNKLSIQT